MPRSSRNRFILCGLAVAAMLTLAVAEADARRGGSFGSRGSRTYAPPPVTQTAPNTAAPINRSVTQPQQRQVTANQAGAAQRGLFNRPGFMGGMLAGFLGAGLLGLLLGNGLLGGLSGLAGFLGLLLQVALVVIVARLLWTWWQRRNAPGYAAAGGPALRDLGNPANKTAPVQGGYGGASPTPAAADAIEIGEADYNAFEQRLADVMAAFSAEDIGRLRTLCSPEIVSYFSEELSDNASRGLVNTIRDVKLLQGDLAEAWREGGSDYATVAMRYASVDFTAERDGGRIVEGSLEPLERTELWTFLRARGGKWILSAIQEA